MSGFLRQFRRLHPMLRAGITSGTIMASGDVLCQTIQQRYADDGSSSSSSSAALVAVKDSSSPHRDGGGDDANRSSSSSSGEATTEGGGGYDPMRTARFGLTGLTLHGPFFNKTLGILEKVVGPAVCARAAAKKVALGHFILFPSYTILFYGYMSTFEGKGLAGGMQKLRDTWWDIWRVGTGFWPAANMINFMYCPPVHRVLYLNVMGLFWNAFLSFQNAKSNATSASASSAVVVASAKEA